MMNRLLNAVRERWFASEPVSVADTYPSMKALLASVEERDNYAFEICSSRDSSIKLFAPHGGCIEPGTGPIVRELAGGKYDYYIFKGTRKGGGCKKLLHVTSTHYDEERCESMARNALFSLSVHGCRGKGRRIEIGGGNAELANDLYNTLRPKYRVERAPEVRNGENPLNFINVSRYKGVQVELSEGFRSSLFIGYPVSMSGNPETLPEFIGVLRMWLRKVEGKLVV